MYTTADKIAVFLDKSVDEADVADVIAAAKDLIDNETGREFGSIADGYNPTASARYFDGNSRFEILIDDFFALTSIQLGTTSHAPSAFDTAMATTEYYNQPINAVAMGRPYTRLGRRNSVWPSGAGNLKVTAKWGYALTPPADIVFAATVLAAGMYTSNRASEGPIKSEKIGNYAVTYGLEEEKWQALTRVREVLSHYRRIEI